MKAAVRDYGDWQVLAPLLLGLLCGLVAVGAGIEAVYCGIYVAEAGQCGCFSCAWDNLASMDPLSARNLAAPEVMGARYAWVACAGVVGFGIFGAVASLARRRLEGRE